MERGGAHPGELRHLRAHVQGRVPGRDLPRHAPRRLLRTSKSSTTMMCGSWCLCLGLGTEYFRILLQSNCGASVLDFIPQTGGRPPIVCLNRLNQGSLGGVGYEPLNMLGVIQSQKTAELLLDLKVNSIICSPQVAAVDTATAICEVQEAADCLGADCIPRYVEMKNLLGLEIDDAFQTKQKSLGQMVQSGWMGGMEYKKLETLWAQSNDAWQALVNELPDDDASDRVIVAVGHPAIYLAPICRCLNLTMDYMPSFHLDDGSISVIDFPDGPKGRGVIRCTNYTAHLGRWSIPITKTTGNDDEF